MAVGDDAVSAGYALVPGTGEDGKVKHGAREINRSRDYTAQTKALIPTTLSAWRDKLGIATGSTAPDDGDGKPDTVIYFKIV